MESYDLIVLGGGPAGYGGAIRAGQLGIPTLLIEENRPGGVCLFSGCIPSKGYIEFARLQEKLKKITYKEYPLLLPFPEIWKKTMDVVEKNARGIENYLFKKYGVKWIQGKGKIAEKGVVEVKEPSGATSYYRYKNLLLATGSREKWLPNFSPQPPWIVTSGEIFTLKTLPKKVAIVGGGVIGSEFAYIFHSLGSEVTLVELTEFLLPGMDLDLRKGVTSYLKKKNIQIYTRTPAPPPTLTPSGVRLPLPGKEEEIYDLVLVAVGRTPNSQDLGLSQGGVPTDSYGFIPTDPLTYSTPVPGIYAVGDLRSPPFLAHKATLEAVRCVERIAGLNPPPFNPLTIPQVVYTEPEVASVGYTEEEVKEKGIPYQVGIFPFSALGRARISHDTEGFIKVILRKDTHALLGVHIFSPHGGDMISLGSLAISGEMTAEDLLAIPYPHPTYMEAFQEALHLALEGKTIHL